MFTYNSLLVVHITAHTDQDRTRVLHLLGRLLGAGNSDKREGYYPGYVPEEDIVFSHWFDGNLDKLSRITRYLVRLRAALDQEAILFEVFAPAGQFAIGIEAGDSARDVFEHASNLLTPIAV